jgi:hypothetical protein
MQLRRRAYKDPHRFARRWRKRARFTNTPVFLDLYPPVKKLPNITPILMPPKYGFAYLWTSKPTISIGYSDSGVMVPNSGFFTWRLIRNPEDYIIKVNFAPEIGNSRAPKPCLLDYGKSQRIINLLQFKLTGISETYVCITTQLTVVSFQY